MQLLQEQQQQQVPEQLLQPQHGSIQSADQIPHKATNSLWKQVQLGVNNKESPSARWGHSFVKANNDLLYLFGGYAESNYMNDSWTFDLKTCQWAALDKQGGNLPKKRSNHSGCYLEKQNKILIFGGGGKEKKRFNDIHLLDIVTNDWKEIKPSNFEQVTPRTYHTANLFFDQFLAVFGGEGVGDLNDLSILCLEPQLQWLVLQTQGPVPPKRRFHSSAVVQNKLYILGGCFSNYRCHDDIWEINLGQYLLDSQNITLEWKQIQHYNHVFQPRWGQCSQVFEDKIYIFGGRNLKDLNETIVFDPSRQSDNIIRIDQTSPNPRRRGAAVVVGSSIVVFGGFDGIYYNDIHYLNITQIECEQSLKIDNEQHYKFLQNLMYSQKNYDMEIQLISFKVGIHKIIVVERMNDPKNREFLNKIETSDKLYFIDKDFEQRFFINTVIQYMYLGILDYRQIRNQKDLNSLQEFAYEIKLITLLDALNQNEQWIRQEIQSTQVQRFNHNYFQRYFCQNKAHKNFITFINPSKMQMKELDIKNQMKEQNKRISDKVYDSTFIIVNDLIWFEENEIYNQYSDVTFICEEKQICANKFLLSSQSLYFKNIFDQEFMEKSESVIYIEIISFNTFKIVLNFIYYHKIVIPQFFEISDWLNLIKASNYFQISHLQEIIEIELIKLIEPENIFNLYYSSILYNCPKLHQNCSQYFAQKMYKPSLFINQDHSQMEDQILQQMEIESGKIYEMLKFQIKQDEIEYEKNRDKIEIIDMEFNNSQTCKNIYNFISNVHKWENQEEIIFRLKSFKEQKRQNCNRDYICNNCSGNFKQFFFPKNNCKKLQAFYNSDSQSNNCRKMCQINQEVNGSEIISSIHSQKDYIFQTEKFSVKQSLEIFKNGNTIQQDSHQIKQNRHYLQQNNHQLKQNGHLIQQQNISHPQRELSLNSTINNENSFCFSGRSCDSISISCGLHQNITKIFSDNGNSDSDENDLINNAMVDEHQIYQEFKINEEYSL